ncbi:MAG: glycosyltransferase family 2 protein [Phycisphaerales bacterium]
MILALLSISLAIALAALVLALANLRRIGPAPSSPGPGEVLVSICVPARNEEANLEACVRSLLAQSHSRIEVLVYDDESTDGTPAILGRLVADDARVRRVATSPLPSEWNGKQWGCDRMGRAALGEWILFTDADVRFARACIGRTLAEALRGRDGPPCALVSTVPRQVVGSLGEAVIVPLIHFILLSYLPVGRMRGTGDPAASAGCGQFLFVRRDAWLAVGGHSSFKGSMHDGVKLPRLLRSAGWGTDLFDGTELASCRMYRGFRATWRGFAKNAYEGLGSAGLLVVLTLLHLVGHVFPWIFLAWAFVARGASAMEVALATGAIAAAWAERLLLARRFRHPLASAALHPVGIVLMTAIQWHGAMLHLTGRRSWKGRTAHVARGAA